MRVFLRSLGVSGLLLALLLLGGCGSRGGSDGWVSSGGEIFQDRQNAWWLKNVQTVGYCVAVQRESSSTNVAKAERSLLAAVEFWKQEFAGAGIHPFLGGGTPEYFRLANDDLVNPPKLDLGIATQTFQKVPCAEADLRLVIGSGALTGKERSYLGATLETHLAASVRSFYDPIQMRGRGFIYVASDRGANTPAALRGTNVPTDPMANEVFLTALLAHELGHVFGISHQGVRTSLMAERYPETLVTANYWRERQDEEASAESVPRFLRVPGTWVNCVSDKYLKPSSKFFGAKLGQGDGDDGCPSYSFDDETKRIQIDAYHYKRASRKPLGYIKDLKMVNIYGAAFTLSLNPAQTVFPDVLASFLVGPPVLRSSAGPGTFVSADGRRNASVHYSIEGQGCWRTELYGVINGKITGLSIAEPLCL